MYACVCALCVCVHECSVYVSAICMYHSRHGGQPWKLALNFHLVWDKVFFFPSLSPVWAKLAPSLWILLSVSPISLETGQPCVGSGAGTWALSLVLPSPHLPVPSWGFVHMTLSNFSGYHCQRHTNATQSMTKVTNFCLEKYFFLIFFFYQCEHASWETPVSITPNFPSPLWALAAICKLIPPKAPSSSPPGKTKHKTRTTTKTLQKWSYKNHKSLPLFKQRSCVIGSCLHLKKFPLNMYVSFWKKSPF